MRRKTALGSFTRNENTLRQLITNASPANVVSAQFEKLQACWNKLEEANERCVESLEDEMDDQDPDILYIDAPTIRFDETVKLYSEFAKTSADTVRTELNQAKTAD